MRARRPHIALVVLGAFLAAFAGLVLLIAGAVGGVESLRTLGVLLLVAAVVALVFAEASLRRRGSEALPALARELGLRFSPDDSMGLAAAGLPFDRFRQHGVEVRNVMWGTWPGTSPGPPVDVTAFEQRYETHDPESGWQPTEWRFLALTEVPAECPPLWIARGAGLVATRDRPRVRFEVERFNREVTVLSPEAYFATALVTEEMMAWILDQAPVDVHFELAGNRALTWMDRDEVLAGARLAVWAACEFRRRIPPVIGSLFPPQP